MKVFPLYYKGKDYWITTNGRIFDNDSNLEITNQFSDYERCKMIAVCWIGEIDLPLKFKDKNSKNICRKNINYKVPGIVKLDDGNLLIGSTIFYKVPNYKYYYVSKDAVFYSIFYNKFLHKKISNFPHYVKISLVSNDDIRDTCAVHRIVFYSVSGCIPNKDMEINHIDGRKWVNNFYNLEETSTIENVRHSIFTIKTREGKWNPNEIHYICKMIENGFTSREIYNLPWVKSKVSYDSFKILLHHLVSHTKYWVDISSEYNLSNWNSISKVYSDKSVHKICQLLESGMAQKEIENLLGIPLKYISSIKNRSARTNISSQYKF